MGSRRRFAISNLFVKYFLSYVLFMLVPIIVVTASLYRVTVDQLIENVQNNAASNLNRLTDTLDARMDKFKKLSVAVSQDILLTPYILRTPGYKQLEAIRQLRLYLSGGEELDEVCIRLKDGDLLFTADGAVSSDTFFGRTCVLSGRPLAELDRILDSAAVGRMFPGDWTFTRNQAPVFVYQHPIPATGAETYGNLILVGSLESFTRGIRTLMSAFKGNTYVQDRDGNLLFSTGEYAGLLDAAEVARYARQAAGSRALPVAIRKTDFLVIGRTSAVTGWTTTTFIPERKFYQKAFQTRLLILEIAVLLLAAFTALAWLVSNRQLKPIRQLAAVLQENPDGTEGFRARDELEGIRGATQRILEKNRLLLDQLDNQRPLLARQFLYGIIAGDAPDGGDLGLLAAGANIVLEGPSFCVLAVRAGREKETVAKILDTYFAPQRAGYALGLSGTPLTAMLVNLRGRADDDAALESIASKILDVVREILGKDVVVGVGQPYGELAKMPVSLVEATAAVEYAYRRSDERIVFFGRIQQKEKATFWYPLDEQMKLVIAIKQGNRPVIDAAVRELGRRLEENNPGPPMLDFIRYDTVNAIVKLSHELDLQDDLPTSRLMSFTTTEDMLQRLREAAHHIAALMEARRGKEDPTLFARVLDYIDRHYADPNFSQYWVADAFDLSASHCSRFFKEQAGVNFSHHVSRKRLEAAKKLLAESDTKIADVVRQVGYTNVTSFTKKFTLEEGVSPGRYRHMRRAKNGGKEIPA
jgi:two-component system, response regulator YesN